MSKIPDMTKKRVFITGATGNMGGAALKELLGRRDRFDIVLLARPGKKNIKKLKYLKDEPGVDIIWGDLTDYDSVLKGVTGADYVLHIGGMVSPAADMYPERTLKVNVQGARNVVNAVKAQPNRDDIGVVYIGSVAQVGNHLSPRHWGRTGDPIYTSVFDWYSVSKCLAELIFTESGLKKWVSIRQTGMLYPALLMKANDPIACHVPLKGVLEWSTLEDSGRVCANVCEDWVPDSFWRRFYNLSSGPSFRLTNYEFDSMLLKGMGCPPVEKVFGADWFATTRRMVPGLGQTGGDTSLPRRHNSRRIFQTHEEAASVVFLPCSARSSLRNKGIHEACRNIQSARNALLVQTRKH